MMAELRGYDIARFGAESSGITASVELDVAGRMYGRWPVLRRNYDHARAEGVIRWDRAPGARRVRNTRIVKGVARLCQSTSSTGDPRARGAHLRIVRCSERSQQRMRRLRTAIMAACTRRSAPQAVAGASVKPCLRECRPHVGRDKMRTGWDGAITPSAIAVVPTLPPSPAARQPAVRAGLPSRLPRRGVRPRCRGTSQPAPSEGAATG